MSGTISTLLLGLVQTAAGSQEAYPTGTPHIAPCAFDHPAIEVTTLAGLPVQVRMELARFFKAGGGLADAGASFNSTDYIMDRSVPSRRFVRAYLIDDVWFIWYERGGYVGGFNTLALTQQRGIGGSAMPYQAAPGSGFEGDLCVGSKAFLSGARAASAM